MTHWSVKCFLIDSFRTSQAKLWLSGIQGSDNLKPPALKQKTLGFDWLGQNKNEITVALLSLLIILRGL